MGIASDAISPEDDALSGRASPPERHDASVGASDNPNCGRAHARRAQIAPLLSALGAEATESEETLAAALRDGGLIERVSARLLPMLRRLAQEEDLH